MSSEYDPPQVKKYFGDTSDGFSWHVDHYGGIKPFQPNIHKPWFAKNDRKISMSMILNDQHEYKGGEFLYDQGFFKSDNNVIPTVLHPGDIIMFPSYVMHAVKPVSEGIRQVFVAFINGPHLK